MARRKHTPERVIKKLRKASKARDSILDEAVALANVCRGALPVGIRESGSPRVFPVLRDKLPQVLVTSEMQNENTRRSTTGM